MIPQITLQPNYLSSGLVRIDVVGKVLPEYFLGMAFDLVVPKDWKFHHIQLCGVFSSAGPGGNSNFFHLVSAKPETQRVVFGLVVTGGGYEHPPDGCISSFYFQLPTQQAGGQYHGPSKTQFLPSKQSITFEHTTMSVYKNGRHDLGAVQWQRAVWDTPQNLPHHRDFSSDSTFVSDVHPQTQQKIYKAGDSQQAAEVQPASNDPVAGFSQPADPSPVHFYESGSWVVLFLLVIFSILFFYFRFKHKDS